MESGDTRAPRVRRGIQFLLCAAVGTNSEPCSINEDGDRIPREHLESKFGPAVNPALETLKGEMKKRRNGKSSELMETLILYQWKDALGHLQRDPVEIDWTSEPTIYDPANGGAS